MAAVNITVVGIGASSGGLEACQKLMDALPPDNGMAFILVQHLDPTHDSMMVELLAGHTTMAVRQAADGMAVERDHVYVIPPGTYLSVGDGALHLSPPQAPHGARLPFDFLLHSLADVYGPRAVGVVLSGTGADGSLGMKAIREKCGLVIAQDPTEAGFDGMPRSAIRTGVVDLVLPVAAIPDALITYDRRMLLVQAPDPAAPADWLPEVIALLRSRTAFDFTRYKEGTLRRRTERRMAMVAAGADGMESYLDILRADPGELDLLARDLLINVTQFFRDPAVFDYLAEKVVPGMVESHPPDQPLRIWIAGCSTGEETYSLTMIFLEGIVAAKRAVKLQVFASDVDPDAVATARNGVYPETIANDVSPARLARFFTKEDQGYRVSSDMRAVVVFTVQDLLADPPFSRLDLISCRNLMIYLQPEAQAKVISIFHFALRDGGVLLLGSAETVGDTGGRFTVISKAERLYRHVGGMRPGDFNLPVLAGDGIRPLVRVGQGGAPPRQAVLADLTRRLVAEGYAPAAVLVNRRYECLYSLGPTDRYLRVAPGYPSHDLLTLVRPGVRTALRSALERASQENTPAVVSSGRMWDQEDGLSFSIDVQRVRHDGEDLLLVCFIDAQKSPVARDHPAPRLNPPNATDLERELEITRMALQDAIRNLEISSEEQRAINEEALSVNEEYQSTNEELLTSKEELQSLNEELTALNSQLQETLERQRTTSDDLQNVLYSTDIATLFLDTELKIRFFTPATRALFSIIPGDVGRPLADLRALAADGSLLTDAQAVLRDLTAAEKEIEAPGGLWFVRRILPYRTHGHGVEGVVVTFTDITERKRTAQALEDAKREAEQATAAKSSFLAAASHDLRQPLQTLALLQGILAKAVDGPKAQALVARLDETLGAMAGMLNALLDINQIEAGVVSADVADFPVNDLFDRLRDEFTYHAQAQGLQFRLVPCSVPIRSDPRLLEQMLRNLLSNALKYTKQGRVLMGCRRYADHLSIEVWDTGIGIPEVALKAIFEEYHQLDNTARVRSRGLGLGLSIVQRLGALLGHRVNVRSWTGRGSVFAIEIQPPPHGPIPVAAIAGRHRDPAKDAHRTGILLVVEDDPEVRSVLCTLLKDDGHHIVSAADGAEAVDLMTRGGVRPDLMLADYDLPGDLDGLQTATRVREKLGTPLPVMILTGDISTRTLRAIADHDCLHLNKPMKARELLSAVQGVLTRMPPPPALSADPEDAPEDAQDDAPGGPVIFIVDDDAHVRDSLREVLEADGRIVRDYASCEVFLEAYRPGGEACLLVDAALPGMKGLDLLRHLKQAGHALPAIMITGNGDVPLAVDAMKAGVSDFIEKPASPGELLISVDHALERARDGGKLLAWHTSAAGHMAELTDRQRQIMDMVLAGHPSKNIAADLGISQRTVENHRAAIMKRTGAKSLPALARLALAAAWTAED